MQSTDDTPCTAGTSSLGMSGINAHAILQGPPPAPTEAEGLENGSLIWQRARHWVAPAAHHLLASFQPGAVSGTVELVADLCAPSLAYLFDHQV